MSESEEGPTRVPYDYYDAAQKFPEFSRDEIDVFIETFHQFDADGSGAIDANELERGFRYMGSGVSKEEIQELIRLVDENNSGEIEWPEFLMIMRKFYPNKKIEYSQNFLSVAKKFPEFTLPEIQTFLSVFRQFDLDGSNTINRKELMKVLSYLGQGVSEDQLEQIFQTVDANGSGEIEWDEFLTMMSFLYPERKRKFEREFYGVAKDFPEFTRGDIEVFVETFREFDEDGSNTMDIDELSKALRYMGQGSSKEEVQKYIDHVDDGTGVVSWRGFLQIVRNIFNSKQEELQKKWFQPAAKFKQFDEDDIAVFIYVFRTFDVDGSGSISASELASVLKFMGQVATPEQIQQFVQQVDADGSGEIEWVEFLQLMAILNQNYSAAAQKSSPKQPLSAQSSSQSSQSTQAAPAAKSQPAETPSSPTTPRKEEQVAPVSSGWLNKLGGRSKNKWQKRWCYIASGQFAWAEQQKSKKKGSINLPEIISVSEVPEHVHKKPNCFAVVTAKKTYFLYGESADETKSWMKALQHK